MRVTILDYGAGNLHSLAKALHSPGVTVQVEEDPRRAVDTELLVLPGVGAFAAAAERLAPGRDAMRDAILDGLPCLGICLGMQLLFEGSDEGPGAGLGVIAGRVERLRARRVPQIGWNSLEDVRDPLFDAAPLDGVYYANSYACRPRDPGAAIAWSTHEDDRFVAAVRARNAVGVQFHPEKSSAAGVAFLRAVVEGVGSRRSEVGGRSAEGADIQARGSPPGSSDLRPPTPDSLPTSDSLPASDSRP